jgi:hypothetical protein
MIAGSGYGREIYVRIKQGLHFWCSTDKGKGEVLSVLN